MKEDDYIIATNWAKLRSAQYVLRDVLFLDGTAESKQYADMMWIVNQLCESTFRRLKVEADDK